MNIRIIPELTLQHFYEKEALELQFYDAEFITPPKESWRWYERYPNTTVAQEICHYLEEHYQNNDPYPEWSQTLISQVKEVNLNL